MYVLLRKRDDDSGGAELLIDSGMQRRDRGEALVQVGNVSPQIQRQAAVPEGVEYHSRLRFGDDVLVLVGSLAKQGHRLVHVTTVGDTNSKCYADHRVRQRPVQQAAGDQLLIRDDEFLVVPIANRRRAYSNFAHGAGCIADGHDVAEAYGLFLRPPIPSATNWRPAFRALIT